jgi:hypothetical protein
MEWVKPQTAVLHKFKRDSYKITLKGALYVRLNALKLLELDIDNFVQIRYKGA